MTINVNIHFYGLPDSSHVLDQVLAGVNKIKRGNTNIMSALSEYAGRVSDFAADINARLDEITADEQATLDLLNQIKNSPGVISAEDQAALDSAITMLETAAAKARAVAAFVPPTIPATPITPPITNNPPPAEG